MNKKLLLVCLLFICIGFGLFAAESEMFVYSTPIVKVYVHQLGYRVVYMKESMDIGILYVPLEFFQGTASQAEAIYGRGAAYPYMSVFWEDGEFSHIRLYLHEDFNHLSWADLDATAATAERFDVETIEVDF